MRDTVYIFQCDLCGRKQNHTHNIPPGDWQQVSIFFEGKPMGDGVIKSWKETFDVCGTCIGKKMFRALKTGLFDKLVRVWSWSKT